MNKSSLLHRLDGFAGGASSSQHIRIDALINRDHRVALLFGGLAPVISERLGPADHPLETGGGIWQFLLGWFVHATTFLNV